MADGPSHDPDLSPAAALDPCRRPRVQEAVSATAMTVCDWWILEAMVLLVGLGKDPDVQVRAAHE